MRLIRCRDSWQKSGGVTAQTIFAPCTDIHGHMEPKLFPAHLIDQMGI